MSSEIAFLGIDTETTGLNPATSHILEIGMVAFDRGLRPIARTSRLLVVEAALPAVTSHGKGLHPAVSAMHRDTGLWADLENWLTYNTVTTYDYVDRSLCKSLQSWHDDFGRPGKPLPMLGSSVHFDRRMMEGRFPRMLAEFSHRNIDASTLLELVRGASPALAKAVEAGFADSAEFAGIDGVQHRVIHDVERSAAMIRHLCSTVDLDGLFCYPNRKD